MELKLIRTKVNSDYTIGKLYIDDVFFCDTLQSGTTEETITGGTYAITFTYYFSRNKTYPILSNVPIFGVAPIHYGGNFLNGNILVGKNSAGTLINCEDTWNSLMVELNKSNDATENINITII